MTNLSSPTSDPTVTVLICTSGRASLLKRCLEALASGTDRPKQLVIVNGADGQTPAIVEHFAPRFDEITLIVHPNRNLATLRNFGIPHCSGDIVAMTDDDAIPGDRWLEVLRSAHAENPGAGGIGGPVSAAANNFASRVADSVVFPEPVRGRTIFTLPTVNMSYKRAAMEAAGLFDETLFRGEDVDYNWRVIQAGYDLRFEPAMRVRHEHRATIRGLYQQQWMYGRAYYLVRSRWPEMYAVYPHSLKSLRAWAKLAYCALAILVQPWGVSKGMSTTADRLRAYPILVGHHLIWKLGMASQAWGRYDNNPLPHEVPSISRWRDGRRIPNEDGS